MHAVYLVAFGHRFKHTIPGTGTRTGKKRFRMSECSIFRDKYFDMLEDSSRGSSGLTRVSPALVFTDDHSLISYCIGVAPTLRVLHLKPSPVNAMKSCPLVLLLTLLSAPLVAAWVQPSRPLSVAATKAPAVVTQLSAFQLPTGKKFRRPHISDDDYEPYDWENDSLGYVDEENERPWKIDELTSCYEEPPSVHIQTHAPSRLSRWNPFSKLTTREPQPPINSRARLSTTDAGTLVIDLPATGVDSSAISSGVFGALWFSAVAPVTFAGGIATAAFMLPFWLAGGFVAKNALVDPFTSSQLSLGKYAWSLKTSYGPKELRQVEGSTQDLRGASVEDLNVQVNGKPFYELKLYGDRGVTGFGNGLEPQELEYLASVINKHLQEVKRDDVSRGDDGIYGFISGRGGD